MSEDRNLNTGGSSPDAVRLLHSLAPEPLDVNRDELFFQAGYTAGARGLTARFVWPLAAAALLVICAGLGIALLRQADELQTALAGRTASNTVASGDSAAKPPLGRELGAERQAAAVFDPRDRYFSDERSRQWRRLVSPAPLPPGRLTAGGWSEARAGLENVSRPVNPIDESETPRRPSTYLELLHQYQEG